MVLDCETDQGRYRESYHWSLWPACELVGVALVWSLGFEALGYPPTWIHTRAEADRVEQAIQEHFRSKKSGTSN